MDDFAKIGWTLKARALPDAMLKRLLGASVAQGALASVHRPSGRTYGLRGLLWSSPVLSSALAASGLSRLASDVVGRQAFPIDAIYFDKTADANWSVPGHQDRLMPVASGCVRAKANRSGIEYAEPSVATLSKLVALRVHFDDVAADAGALEVLPGSHRSGVLSPAAIGDIPLTDYHPCAVSLGDVLVMRPLLLHRSARRAGPGQRRVLHVVYATEQPEAPLLWRSSA
jgi:Phytanoyl-CoA dioxygenase (PhyH)